MTEISQSVIDDEILQGRLASRSIALMSSQQSLTATESSDRSLIHRTRTARPEVDAFRELRTRLLATSNENFVTLVAPISRGAGGSFTARNLAAAFALDDSKSALLIDCDLRHPSQHLTLRIDANHGGLIDYLEDAERDVSGVIYDTGAARLRLIPAGNSREAVAEYFSSHRMRLLVDSLRSRYDDRYLFLDGPPVLAGPDARILSDLADIVVLVTGYGCDSPTSIAEAAACFDPNKLAGVVFNEGV